MDRMHGIQYTIRSVPAGVDRALRLKAKKSGKSLNQVILESMVKGAGLEHELHSDLDWFFGSWIEDPEMEQAFKEQEKIDPEIWK